MDGHDVILVFHADQSRQVFEVALGKGRMDVPVPRWFSAVRLSCLPFGKPQGFDSHSRYQEVTWSCRWKGGSPKTIPFRGLKGGSHYILIILLPSKPPGGFWSFG